MIRALAWSLETWDMPNYEHRILVADIGNTHAHLGIFHGQVLVARETFPSSGRVTDDLIADWQSFASGQLEAVILASVNPKVRIPFCHWSRDQLGLAPKIVLEDLAKPLPLKVDNPEEVGADRVVNAFWAARSFPGEPVVIVDFGTAITFDVVSHAGDYLGGLITPGLHTAASALAERTALLPSVRVHATQTVIGKNTIDSINAGIFHGYTGLVDAICDAVATELGINTRPPQMRVIATGGDAAVIAEGSQRIEYCVPDLTLQGLRLIYEEFTRETGSSTE